MSARKTEARPRVDGTEDDELRLEDIHEDEERGGGGVFGGPFYQQNKWVFWGTGFTSMVLLAFQIAEAITQRRSLPPDRKITSRWMAVLVLEVILMFFGAVLQNWPIETTSWRGLDFCADSQATSNHLFKNFLLPVTLQVFVIFGQETLIRYFQNRIRPTAPGTGEEEASGRARTSDPSKDSDIEGGKSTSFSQRAKESRPSPRNKRTAGEGSSQNRHNKNDTPFSTSTKAQPRSSPPKPRTQTQTEAALAKEAKAPSHTRRPSITAIDSTTSKPPLNTLSPQPTFTVKPNTLDEGSSSVHVADTLLDQRGRPEVKLVGQQQRNVPSPSQSRHADETDFAAPKENQHTSISLKPIRPTESQEAAQPERSDTTGAGGLKDKLKKDKVEKNKLENDKEEKDEAEKDELKTDKLEEKTLEAVQPREQRDVTESES
ncbi:hypothetical protein BJ508DRAFT_364295 [Ascobolus immersus RN42]|uniref:Uncharacterized protein n=1 Tax=Ascobolus immersus RN42 TaxID=1160509 RepID=A0A3N4HYW5_ASCIM|nr:hypothetical protein BJ508DRAFT_364295 [Ascobolus immersus RN42]